MRRCPLPAPEKQAFRSSVGACEPVFIARRRKSSQSVVAAPKQTKNPNHKGWFPVHRKLRLIQARVFAIQRRCPLPAPEKQAFRSSVGACEPVFIARRRKSSQSVVAAPKQTKNPNHKGWGLFWSCYPDLNRGPHPYQGCALPTEP